MSKLMGIKANLKLQVFKFSQLFWNAPNRLFSIRAVISMSIVLIPFIIINKPYFGVTLALGVLAGALSETDDHPKGRLKALSITIFSFFISSLSVGLLHNHTWLLGAGFIASTIVFIVLGGLGERYRAITFGSILVGIYAMLGSELSPAWYWQAILLPAGALFHGLFSLILLYRKPFRLLDEQLANGFLKLSNYLEKKALLFPSTKEEQETINNELAIINISLVNSLEKTKEVLNNFSKEVKDPDVLFPYVQRFMLLQSLHERASSTHERHDKLSKDETNIEVVEGFGELLRQMAHATRQLSISLLTGSTYQHPAALEWISTALDTKLKTMDPSKAQSLILLHHNLYRSHISLKHLDNAESGTSVPRLRKDERTPWERIRAQLNFKHPRMRYAIRLSISFLIGYSLAHVLDLHKGAWVVLTSLFVSQITYSDTRRRLFQRLLGTISGILIGILLLQIFTTTASQVLLMLASAMAFLYWVKSNYSLAVIFITTFVISAFNLISHDGGFNIIIPRIVDTLIGATLSFLVIRFLWPGWQYRRMPKLVSNAMEKNATYLQAIDNAYQHSDYDDLAYRIARREAHLAHSELAQAWNSMRIEPKSKRILLQQSLTLTYLNHALLSYLSALGSYRDNKSNTNDDHSPANQIIETLNQAAAYFEDPNNKELDDLSLLLMELKQKVNNSQLGFEKQQLRLYYNIAGSTSKMIKALPEMNEGRIS